MGEIAKLLEKALESMESDADDEKKRLAEGVFPRVVNPEKYLKARRLFLDVLELDPGNAAALEGVKNCDAMLDEHHPVQYMGPPPDEFDHSLLEPASGPGPVEKAEPEADSRKPWEIRREMLAELRENDRKGLEYTREAFSRAREDARVKIDAIVKKARDRMERESPQTIFRDAKKEMEELQAALHQCWKGHGPEVLEDGLRRLGNLNGVE